MAKHGRGLICLALTEERIRELGLPMMVSDNQSPLGTAFTVSIDAQGGRHQRRDGAGPRHDDSYRDPPGDRAGTTW